MLERGKITDIDFNKIEAFSRSQGIYCFLKNTTKLFFPIVEIDIAPQTENLEQEIVESFRAKNPHRLNEHISALLYALNIEKKEDESSRVFEDRLLSEAQKTLFP